jgi:hypothetical protein
LSRLRVFGCKAFVKLEKSQSDSLGPQSEAGILLGYQPNSKACRVLVGTRVEVSRNVKFSEEKHVMLGDGEDGHEIVDFSREDGQIVNDEGDLLPVRFSHSRCGEPNRPHAL